MKKILFLGFIIFSITNLCFTQTYSEGSFPDGQYKFIEDFLNRKPTSNINCLPYFPEGAEDDPIPPNLTEKHVVFRQEDNLKKMRDYFAIVKDGKVYINQWWIFNLEEDKKSQNKTRNSGNFVLVLKYGKFMYLEGHFNSLKTKGYIIEHDKDGRDLAEGEGTSHANRTFCIIFNPLIKEFDVFRNCDEFNRFLQTHKFADYIACDQKHYTLKNVRSIIDKIFEQ